MVSKVRRAFIASLAASALGGGLSLLPSPAEAKSGQIQFRLVRAGFIIGFGGGEGVLVFDGNDTYDGEFFYLFLLKGPRQADPGIRPLLATLRRALAPFRVVHEWKTGTVQNRVYVTWSE